MLLLLIWVTIGCSVRFSTIIGIVALLARLIAALTRLIASTRLITTFLLSILRTGTVALLTRLIATLLVIIIAGTIGALRCAALQTGSEPLRTETALLLILVLMIAALIIGANRLMNTWTG